MDFVSERMIKFYYFSSLLILVGLVKAKQWNSIYKRVHPIVVTKNQLLHTIPEIGKEWNIELEFMATSFVQDTDSHKDTNFLLILNPNLNLVTLGVKRGTKHIGFCVLLTPRKQRCQLSSTIVELNKWMHLKVTQVQKDGKSMVTVFIGGTRQYSEENLPPDKLIDVKLYACRGSQNITPQPGQIRMLSIAVPANSHSPTTRDSFLSADSSWGDWGEWSTCSATCGNSVSTNNLDCFDTNSSIYRAKQGRGSAKQRKELGVKTFAKRMKSLQGAAALSPVVSCFFNNMFCLDSSK